MWLKRGKTNNGSYDSLAKVFISKMKDRILQIIDLNILLRFHKTFLSIIKLLPSLHDITNDIYDFKSFSRKR